MNFKPNGDVIAALITGIPNESDNIPLSNPNNTFEPPNNTNDGDPFPSNNPRFNSYALMSPIGGLQTFITNNGINTITIQINTNLNDAK
jgi:hypothetical protein